ncbi:MAG: hypothetical protein RMK84_09740 [Oscillochloridaceae bacterium]|nr:hypothetical protein [Chloroflexaceae bacterium]MDW8390397.1 hypothetical protein [Oscillochloridaceae bacterium]
MIRPYCNLGALLVVVTLGCAAILAFTSGAPAQARAAQPTPGALVTATPPRLDGLWEGAQGDVTIRFRVYETQIEHLEITYRYGESPACGTDLAYKDILIRSSAQGIVLPLENGMVRGILPANYQVSGIPIGCTLRIEGFLDAQGRASGTLSFTPPAGPALETGVNCLEERKAIPWSAALMAPITPTSPVPDPAVTAAAAPVVPAPTPPSTPAGGGDSGVGWIIGAGLVVIVPLLLLLVVGIKNNGLPNPPQINIEHIGGDKIVVGDVNNSKGVSIGRNAQSKIGKKIKNFRIRKSQKTVAPDPEDERRNQR